MGRLDDLRAQREALEAEIKAAEAEEQAVTTNTLRRQFGVRVVCGGCNGFGTHDVPDISMGPGPDCDHCCGSGWVWSIRWASFNAADGATRERLLSAPFCQPHPY